MKDRTVELARDWNAAEGKRVVLMILNKSVLVAMTASALVYAYVSIDPHVDDVVVGVHNCIPHLIDASFVPFSHRPFEHNSFNWRVTQSDDSLPSRNDVGCRWAFLSWE